jgi:hypothetical protein
VVKGPFPFVPINEYVIVPLVAAGNATHLVALTVALAGIVSVSNTA